MSSPRRTPQKQLAITATAVTTEMAAGAKAAGVAGLKAQPTVILKPGKIIAGYIAAELNAIVE